MELIESSRHASRDGKLRTFAVRLGRRGPRGMCTEHQAPRPATAIEVTGDVAGHFALVA